MRRLEFYTSSGIKRPVRLCEETRKFAYESLNHKYGNDTKKTKCVFLDGAEGFEKMTPLEQYDLAIRKIALEAPIRICDGEMVSGAATLGLAISHTVPARHNGETLFYSVSHLTVDFEDVLKRGVNAILDDARLSLEKHKGMEEEAFLESCISTLESMRIYHKRYLDVLDGRKEYRKNYDNLLNVPFNPATSFWEAVQSLWFTFAFIRLCGNWTGIGRIDLLLGDYLEHDLANGKITLDEAREILAHFFIKGCEWVCGGNYISGDAQHYQNIVLAGVDKNGREATNRVTYLVLDILEELGISDFPTTVRINQRTDERLLRRVAEVIQYGGGIIAVYNEDLIIESLTNYGYPLEEARCFANDGCWEIQIPGKTFFTYQPFDSLALLQTVTLKKYTATFDSFEELYEKYVSDLKSKVNELKSVWNRMLTRGDRGEWKWLPCMPCTVVSVFEKGCIEKGRSYHEGGPIYNVVSPHIGGLPDTVNSLYAIKKLVFDDKRVNFGTLMEALEHNWEGFEELRLYATRAYSYFGNDNDEVDTIAARLVNDFADACDDTSLNTGYLTPAGISTFGRQLEWSANRLATPYGKRAHDILAPNFSPTPGTDKEGVTSVIRSYCKSNLKRTVSGAALDVKLLPSYAKSEKGINTIVALMKTFVTLGGHFMQLDVADAELLKKAQENPEDYQTLSVRVSGWNARFVTLSREWQNMIIDTYQQ